MKTELIKALKETVLDLKLNRKEYDWGSSESCNCGLLAINCGIHSSDISSAIMMTDGVIKIWSTAAKCLYSKLKTPAVFQRLKDVGLSAEDIYNLENLSDDTICNEARIPHADSESNIGIVNNLRGDKESVIKYMEAWIRILEREEVVPEAPPINVAPNKPMEFITYNEMKTEMELLFQN